jgi:hypothetical protein
MILKNSLICFLMELLFLSICTFFLHWVTTPAYIFYIRFLCLLVDSLGPYDEMIFVLWIESDLFHKNLMLLNSCISFSIFPENIHAGIGHLSMQHASKEDWRCTKRVQWDNLVMFTMSEMNEDCVDCPHENYIVETMTSVFLVCGTSKKNKWLLHTQ